MAATEDIPQGRRDVVGEGDEGLAVAQGAVRGQK